MKQIHNYLDELFSINLHNNVNGGFQESTTQLLYLQDCERSIYYFDQGEVVEKNYQNDKHSI